MKYFGYVFIRSTKSSPLRFGQDDAKLPTDSASAPRDVAEGAS
jgi:hypothetical protein